LRARLTTPPMPRSDISQAKAILMDRIRSIKERLELQAKNDNSG
jgi:hypothetical protein